MNANPRIAHECPASVNVETVSTQPPRLLRLPEVMYRVGLRRSAIYQRMSEGRFPKCRSIGAKCSVWVESEINAWIDSVVTSGSKT